MNSNGEIEIIVFEGSTEGMIKHIVSIILEDINIEFTFLACRYIKYDWDNTNPA